MDIGTWIIVLTCVSFILLAFLGYASFIIVSEFERGVVLTLGRFSGIRYPGIRFVIPALQAIELVDTRVQVVDVAPLEIITADNIFVKVNAIIYYKVYDPRMAILDVGDFAASTKEMAQATLRNAVGGSNLDDIASPDGKIPRLVKEVLIDLTKEWGVRVTNVEIKEINVDPSMIRAISREAEAERNRRAVVIEATGELQAAESFADAANIINGSPGAMELRRLATLANIAGDKTNTIVFPLPTDMASMLGGAKASLPQDVDATKMISDISDHVVKMLSDKSTETEGQ